MSSSDSSSKGEAETIDIDTLDVSEALLPVTTAEDCNAQHPEHNRPVHGAEMAIGLFLLVIILTLLLCVLVLVNDVASVPPPPPGRNLTQ
jgi:hypothetical protein